MNISELMTKNVDTCLPDDRLDLAARKMWDDDVGAIPVVDDARHVVGMITDRDVCMAAYTKGLPLSGIPVRDAMAANVVSCRATDGIAQAERQMREHQVRRLPVVDGDSRLAGIVSLNDLARAAHGSHRNHAEVVGTLAAIGAPRRPVAVTRAG